MLSKHEGNQESQGKNKCSRLSVLSESEQIITEKWKICYKVATITDFGSEQHDYFWIMMNASVIFDVTV